MNIYQKLNAARTEFHALPLQKTGHNKFAGYYYFELGDFLIPALSTLSKNGITAVVSFAQDVATMTLVNTDKPDETIIITSPMGSAALKGCHEVQNIGAVETYQRRYLWCAALEIVEHDAVDASEPVDVLAAVIKAIATAKTLEALKAQYQAAIKMHGANVAITGAKDKRKKELETVAA
jgi:ERF superfamily